MMYVLCLFRCPRHVLFRPSAIAVGWVLAQYVTEIYLT